MSVGVTTDQKQKAIFNI